MMQMLELSDGKCKVIMVNVLKAAEKKVDDMNEQMGNFNREMKKLSEKFKQER